MKKTEVMQISRMQAYLEEKKMLAGLIKNADLNKVPVIKKITGRFLEIICLFLGPENILEIGCGTGFSSYFLIKNLKKGYYTGIDLNQERVKKAEKFIRSKFPEKKFQFLTGNALKIIPDLKDKFDLVFIDAAKYEYPLYIKAVENKLKSGAIIVADNIFYGDKIFKKEISKHDLKSVNGIKEYISYVTNSGSFSSYFFDTGDGILITEFLKK
ncbi:MAG TPA: methyltransferase domain-containing protein [Candidatus Hydromicrobium sp.]